MNVLGEVRKGRGKSLGNIWGDYDLIYGLLVLKSDCPADSSGASNRLWGGCSGLGVRGV